MVWVDSPKFFFAFLETLTNVANAMVDADLHVLSCGAFSALPATEQGPPYTLESLTHIDCYMDDIIYMAQGGTEQQH